MGKKLWRWRIVSFVVIVGLLSTVLAGCGNQPKKATTPAKTTKGNITIGYVNWAEDVAVTNLWQQILTDQGYKVTLKSLDVAPLFVGLSRGDLDVFMDSWLPHTHKVYWDKYKNQLSDYGIWYQGPAKIGFVVPDYVTVNSIAQMNSVRSKFKGEIIGIDPGAGEMGIAAKVIKDYGLKYKLVPGSEAAMMAALAKAYSSHKWIAITGWSPHWMFAKYNLKFLADPKAVFGQPDHIHTLANKNFATKMPAVAAMLKRFKMTPKQLGTLEGWINQGMTPQAAAKKWISANKSVVAGWVK